MCVIIHENFLYAVFKVFCSFAINLIYFTLFYFSLIFIALLYSNQRSIYWE